MRDAIMRAYPPRWIRATWPRSPRSGDQDELSADVAALADAVGLGSAVERERLHLDHELVLCQQFGGLRQRLHGPAVRAATGYPGSSLTGCEVGDGQYLRWLGDQADQLLDRGLARNIEYRVDPPAGSGLDAAGHALAVQHADHTDLPQVVLVGLAHGGDHPHPRATAICTATAPP